MKRTLSLVLALVMVLGTFTMAFADMTDAEVVAGELLEELGVLEGDGKGNLYLDVELKRQDAVVLLSRLMDEEDIAINFPVEEEDKYSDVENDFYFGYLAWAKANGTFEGKGTGEFGFDDVIDAQSYAKVLLTALGYVQGVDFEYDEALELANEKGIVAVDENGNVTRGTMAVMTVEALAVEMKDGSMTLAEKLEITMPEEPVVEATKVESVYAENLREVVVVFDGEVDAKTAEDESNYLISDVTFESATLSEDMTTVTLMTEETLSNQKEYEITVSNVKAGETTLATEKVKFTTLDNALPVVTEVRALGTKALKVIVSEPVKQPSVSSFKVDGKTYFGAVSVDGRVITLKPYSAASVLTVGEHTLTVVGLTDYFNLKSLSQEFTFDVMEDSSAPTVVEVTATLERAEVTFDEDVDPDTVNKDNFYWKSGDSKKKPDSVKVVNGNKVVLDFDTNKLPAYETSLYVINVADYSANKMAETAVSVRATVDETRPEVIEAKLSDDNDEVVIRFNKNVTAERENFVFKDKKDKVVSVKKVDPVDNIVTVTLYKALPEGDNTLEISGVKDTTTLKNVMIPKTITLTVGDTEAPEVSGISANSDTRTIIVNFSESMDLASISNPSNYLITFKGNLRGLPNGTEITPIQSGKAVMIILPEKIGSEVVRFVNNDGTDGNVTHIQIMGVEDLAGKILSGYVYGPKSLVIASQNAVLENYDDDTTKYAVMTDSNTIKIKFNQAIGTVVGNPIKVDGKNPSSIKVDGSDIVTIELSTDKDRTAVPTLSITIVNDTDDYLKTLTEGKAAGHTLTATDVDDRVAPKVLSDVESPLTVTQNTYKIDVEFTETLDFDSVVVNNAGTPEADSDNAAATNIAVANDFKVVRVSDGKVLTANTHYKATINSNKVTIEIIGNGVDESEYTIEVKDAVYLQDTHGNTVEASSVYYTETLY